MREALHVDAQLGGQLRDRRGLHFRHLADAIFVAQERHGLLVEELKRHPMRLLHDGPPVGDVGVVAVIGALVQEALALQVHDQAVGIGVLLVEVGDGAIAGGRRVEVPGDRVRPRPMPVRLRTGIDRGANGVAGVEAAASHFGQVPAGAQVASTHLGVGFEAARGDDHGIGRQRLVGVAVADHDANDAASVSQQVGHLALVADVEPGGLRRFEESVGEPFAGTHRLHDEGAVEDQLAIYAVRLTPGHERPAHALLAQPGHRGERLPDQGGGEALVDQAVADAGQVVVHRRGGIRAHINAGHLGVAEVRDQRADRFNVVIGETEAAAGEERVAATLVARRLLQHSDVGAPFACGESGAECCVARPHYHDMPLLVAHDVCLRGGLLEGERWVLRSRQMVPGVIAHGQVFRRQRDLDSLE